MSPHISPKQEPATLPPAATMMPGSAAAGLDEILTKKGLAPRLHVTIRTIENWQRRGVLPYVKIGKVVLFVWADVLEALKNFRVSRRTCK
jgi:hypothetical protein